MLAPVTTGRHPGHAADLAVRDWSEMLAGYADLLQRRTGRGVAEWNRHIRAAGLPDEPTLRAWLAERGVTGYAQMLLVMETFGYPDFLLAGADELIAGQYVDRPALRPVFDRVLAVSATLADVHVQARKTYVSLVTPRRQFAVVKPTTRTRVDLGLRLDGVEPGGRLEPAKRLANDTINLRVALHTPDDVDDEVVDLVARAHAANR
ncbi:MAG: DUF5655 domain-containing protein [Actinomycetota bacterium]|nr:DUF5655 domain-containing protein [Actinomycetota bacterium]